MSESTPESTQKAMADYAHDYAKRLWRVISVYKVKADGTCACGVTDIRDGVDHHAAGKHPIGRKWQTRASNQGGDIEGWFRENPNNIGIATGEESGLFVLDVDPDNGGFETLAALVAEHGPLPDTWESQTGSGGAHYGFEWPGFAVTNSAGLLGPGLDIRGNGGQIVAPPSVSSKGEYKLIRDVAPAPAPEWLLDLLKPVERPAGQMTKRLTEAPPGYVESALARATAALEMAKPGGRNDALNKHVFAVATMLPHGVITRDEIIEAFTPVALGLGLSVAETRFHIDHAMDDGEKKPREWPPLDHMGGLFIPFTEKTVEWPMREWNDFGNAVRLVDHHPGRLLWIEQADRWAAYVDTRWEMDTTRTAQRLSQETIASLPDTEAFSYSDTDAVMRPVKGGAFGEMEEEEPCSREKFLKWVQSQKFFGKITAMMQSAKGVRGMSATMTDFDPDPWLLNCQNGVLDLRDGVLLSHDPTLMQMQQVATIYDPSATCPRWEAFLAKMQPNPDVRNYLQRALGYSLTGDIGEQKMFMHLGEGANGKSVMLEVLTGVLGSYAQAIPRTTLIVTPHDQIPTDVARMVGKRFLQASESGKGRTLDEEQVKGLTGGEEQSARFMRQDFFDFKPTGKIHYVTNHFPKVSEAPSIWRRLVIIKWPVIIADDDPERDRTLGLKILAEEAAGVLAWLVRGLAMYRADGLTEPALMKVWQREYRDDADEFAEFVDDKLSQNPRHGFCPVQRLYDAYVSWVEVGGRGRAMSVKAFSAAMKERGFESVRGRCDGSQSRGFVGVQPRAMGDLNAEFPSTPDL